MTTAARPTWDTAKGGEKDLSKLSKQYSSRDLPSHTKLKYRQPGQASHEEVTSKDFKRELEEKEKTNKEKITSKPLIDLNLKKLKYDATINLANLDADDPIEEEEDIEDESNEEDDDEEMAELMAELQRIKKERALENAKKEQEQKLEQEKVRTENILSGNPLLHGQNPGFKIKRRWDDDVVFKNCAKGDVSAKPKQFINDMVRSEFHKRFMEKYIK